MKHSLKLFVCSSLRSSEFTLNFKQTKKEREQSTGLRCLAKIQLFRKVVLFCFQRSSLSATFNLDSYTFNLNEVVVCVGNHSISFLHLPQNRHCEAY